MTSKTRNQSSTTADAASETGLQEDLARVSGVAQEVPLTQPFEGYTYLRKEWVDQEDGIDRVQLNMTLSTPHLPADWNATQTFTMMPEWGTTPLRRAWIVRLPTHFQGHDRYLFHYFFQILNKDGTEQVTNPFTQYIVPQPFEFLDHGGDFAQVRVHWSVGDWSYPQDAELEVEGIEWGSEFSVSQAPYRFSDRLFRRGRMLRLQRLPVPRRFRGLIWAPKGAKVCYCFQMLRPLPGDEYETLWDNNFGRDYRLTI